MRFRLRVIPMDEQFITLVDADVVLAGGIERKSNAPFLSCESLWSIVAQRHILL